MQMYSHSRSIKKVMDTGTVLTIHIAADNWIGKLGSVDSLTQYWFTLGASSRLIIARGIKI